MGRFILLMTNSEHDWPSVKRHAGLGNSIGPVCFYGNTGAIMPPGNDFPSDSKQGLLCFLGAFEAADQNTKAARMFVERARECRWFESVEIGVHTANRGQIGMFVDEAILVQECDVFGNYTTGSEGARALADWVKQLPQRGTQASRPPLEDISRMLAEQLSTLSDVVQAQLLHVFVNRWRPVAIYIELGREPRRCGETPYGQRLKFSAQSLLGLGHQRNTQPLSDPFTPGNENSDDVHLFSEAVALSFGKRDETAWSVTAVGEHAGKRLAGRSPENSAEVAGALWRLAALLGPDEGFERKELQGKLGLGTVLDDKEMKSLEAERDKMVAARRQFCEVVEAIRSLEDPASTAQIEAVRKACSSGDFEGWFSAVQEQFDKLARQLAALAIEKVRV